MNKTIRGRFAPSPSGRMHLGNLFAALLTWLDIRSLGGELLLRMEDLDPDRCRPAYAEQMADDLLWLGLTWDLGWRRMGDAYCQSQRRDFYTEKFHALSRKGLVYPCYCSRKELLTAPHGRDGARVYDGHCRNLTDTQRRELESQGRKPSWRIQVPEEEISFVDGNFGFQQENLSKDCGDFILRRSDGAYAYQLAVAADDGAMGVTRVVRGWDLLSSTPRQIWLLQELGYPVPDYCHVPLLCAPDGRRLAKRDRDLDMGALRGKYKPEEIIGFLAKTAGLLERYEPVRPEDLISIFSWEKVLKHPQVSILTHSFPFDTMF